MNARTKETIFEFVAFVVVGLLILVVLTACSYIPRIQMGKATVQAPKDAGTPATMNSGEVRTGLVIPPQTKVSIVKVEAVPATGETPGRPATETLTFDFSQASEFIQTANTLAASTGTIDTTVAKKRIDVESKGPLLWAAIGSLIAGVVCVPLKWPTVGICCGISAVVFFAAWKFADIPWYIGLFGLVAAAALAFGYKRAEVDAKT